MNKLDEFILLEITILNTKWVIESGQRQLIDWL